LKGIRKLAEQLNVSTCTVSRALNDHPGVSEKTRKRVQQAALEFGYVPNQAGRSLRKGVTNTVGFMMQSGGTSTENLDNYDNFFVGVIDGIKSAFGRHNLDLILLPCSVDEDPNEYLRRIVSRGLVDAVIISATMYKDQRIELLTKAKIPFVALGRSGPTPRHTWIDLDFEGVARSSVARLVAAGHRRIALTLPYNSVNLGYVFLDGYKKALGEHGIAFDPSLVFRAHSAENGGYQAAHEILAMEDRPTAVLLNYELMAVGLYRRFAESGIRPGRDIAVIGFREGPVSRFLSPTLTCHRMSLRDLGLATGEALLAQLPAYADFYPEGARNKIWPLEMVAGESDGFHLAP
jgi:DNA-binding LacI/PurR family transcriptional regulator